MGVKRAYTLVLYILYLQNIYFRSDNHSNLLDGCYHVYLDVGSNIGVQVRKLYQPQYYPGAAALNVFKEAFGE